MLGATLTPLLWLCAMVIGVTFAWVTGQTISKVDWVLLSAYTIGCGGYILYILLKGKKS